MICCHNSVDISSPEGSQCWLVTSLLWWPLTAIWNSFMWENEIIFIVANLLHMTGVKHLIVGVWRPVPDELISRSRRQHRRLSWDIVVTSWGSKRTGTMTSRSSRSWRMLVNNVSALPENGVQLKNISLLQNQGIMHSSSWECRFAWGNFARFLLRKIASAALNVFLAVSLR